MSFDVYLRPLVLADAKISYHWRNDSEIWKYTESRPDEVVTYEMERDWARKVIEDPTRANFAICLKRTDKYIGNVYLTNISNGKGELGIFIGDKSCWGNGYARQAIELLKQEACKLGVSEIEIGVNSENLPALITYLRAGARFSGAGQWLSLTLCLNRE